MQPTLALGLLLLLALGVWVLGEPVGGREFLAVAIIVAAVAVIAWAGPRESGEVPRNLALAIVLGFLAVIALAPFARSAAAAPARARSRYWSSAPARPTRWRPSSRSSIAEDASSGAWAGAAVWVAIVGTVVVMGVISETTALQRSAATRVAPAVLVIQIAVPVVLAPLVGGEGWGGTPLGGAVSGRRRRGRWRSGSGCSAAPRPSPT